MLAALCNLKCSLQGIMRFSNRPAWPLILILCGCVPASGSSYSWDNIPPSQLAIIDGLTLATSTKDRRPAQLSVVCSRQHELHVVMRSKLSNAVTDYLPARDTLQLNINGALTRYDIPLEVAVSSIKDGALTSTVSDPLDDRTIARVAANLPLAAQGNLSVFGIRESGFQFALAAGRADLSRFVKACRARGGI